MPPPPPVRNPISSNVVDGGRGRVRNGKVKWHNGFFLLLFWVFVKLL